MMEEEINEKHQNHLEGEDNGEKILKKGETHQWKSFYQQERHCQKNCYLWQTKGEIEWKLELKLNNRGKEEIGQKKISRKRKNLYQREFLIYVRKNTILVEKMVKDDKQNL